MDETEMDEKRHDALKDVVYELLKGWSYSLGSDLDFSCPNPNRDFWLQFTVLKWDEDRKEWRFGCLIGHPGREIIYDPSVEYSYDTRVTLRSWKGNWDDFCMSAHAREPKEDEIVLSTLYSDFEPHEYEGECWMR